MTDTIYGEYVPALEAVLNDLVRRIQAYNEKEKKQNGEAAYEHLIYRLKSQDSMGGQISLAYAGVYAKQIQSLTLVDSVPADGLRLTEEGRQNFKELQKNNIVLRKAVESCFPYYRDAAGIDRFWRDAMHCSPEIYFSNPETMHVMADIRYVILAADVKSSPSQI